MTWKPAVILAVIFLSLPCLAVDLTPLPADQAVETVLPGLYADQRVIDGPTIKITAVDHEGTITGSINGTDANSLQPFHYVFGTETPTGTAVVKNGAYITIEEERGKYTLQIMYHAPDDIFLIGSFIGSIGQEPRFKIFKKTQPAYTS